MMARILIILTFVLALITGTAGAAQQTIEAGETMGVNKARLNSNFSELYSQAATKWIAGTSYTANNNAIVHGGNIYVCTSSHTAEATTEPGVGADWDTVWTFWGTSIIEDSALDGTWDADQDGASKNAIHDYVVQLDSDLDGDYTDEPWYPSAAGAPTDASYLTASPEAALSAETAVTAFILSLLDDVDAAAARATLGLLIGIDVHAYDPNLPTWPATVDSTEIGYLDGLSDTLVNLLATKYDSSDLSAMASALGAENWVFSGDVDLSGASSVSLGQLAFEGATVDTNQTTFTIVDPTAERFIHVGDFDTRIPSAAVVNPDGTVQYTGLSGAPSVTVSTSQPSGGADGDVWYVVN